MSDRIKELDKEINKKHAELQDLEQRKFDIEMTPSLELWRKMHAANPHWK